MNNTIITIGLAFSMFILLITIEKFVKRYKASKRFKHEEYKAAKLPPIKRGKGFNYERHIRQDYYKDWGDGWTPPEKNPHLKPIDYRPYSQCSFTFSFNLHPKGQAHINARNWWEHTQNQKNKDLPDDKKVRAYKQWQEYKDICHAANGNKCQACGATENLECHEVWGFDYDQGKQAYIQKWLDSKTYCAFCHKVAHIDQHLESEDFNSLLAAYAKYNNISVKRAKLVHLKQALKEREERDAIKYDLDLSHYPEESDHIKVWEDDKFFDFLEQVKEKAKAGK